MRSDINSNHPESEVFKIAFEEYKILLDWTNKLADRRQTTSNLFFGVDGGLLTIIGLTLTQLKDLEKIYLTVFFSLIGLIVSFVWASLLQKYQLVLKFKYTQLQLFEEVLGLDYVGLVTAEDKYFRSGIPLEMTGKHTRLVSTSKFGKFGITLAEKILAQLFVLVFLLLLFVSIYQFII